MNAARGGLVEETSCEYGVAFFSALLFPLRRSGGGCRVLGEGVNSSLVVCHLGVRAVACRRWKRSIAWTPPFALSTGGLSTFAGARGGSAKLPRRSSEGSPAESFFFFGLFFPRRRRSLPGERRDLPRFCLTLGFVCSVSSCSARGSALCSLFLSALAGWLRGSVGGILGHWILP